MSSSAVLSHCSKHLLLGLDVNGDYLISVEEFMERCVQLRGPARSVDLYSLKQQNVTLALFFHVFSPFSKRFGRFHHLSAQFSGGF